jgi:hypothetical protein
VYFKIIFVFEFLISIQQPTVLTSLLHYFTSLLECLLFSQYVKTQTPDLIISERLTASGLQNVDILFA